MTAFNEQWQGFDSRARIGLIVGAALIILATLALGAWTFRTDYQVLFADLAPQDAATMVAELDRMKTPYRLSDGGNTILVPTELVYKTRLKLVGKELPLRGAVGFELFNNSEVGMTEFAQKVNYQRALQGELTRTILSLDEILSARVHLVLSEQGLFKKNGTQAKASVTIAMKPGKVLDASHVQGIQRLVSAAVPDIKPEDVTIVDQHGLALTRRSVAGNEDAGMSSDGLDDKRAIEAYLNKKVVEVLDRTFGAGQGIASVDVTLSHEQTKVTTENVLAANTDDQGTPIGVMVHERQTSRESNGDGDATHSAAATTAGNGLVSREANYQVGRRVEQVVSGAGSISHVNVAVVVRRVLDQTQLDRLKDVVAVAVGINKARGDAIAVYSVDQFSSSPGGATANQLTTELGKLNAADAVTAPVIMDTAESSAAAKAAVEQAAAKRFTLFWQALLACVVLLALLALWWRAAGRRREDRQLSPEQRDQMLAQVHDWLETPAQKQTERS